jgi:hypothetical protein
MFSRPFAWPKMPAALETPMAETIKTVSEVVMIETRLIKAYKNNPRINDQTVAKLCEILPVTGFNQPLVLTRDNVVVKGDARLKAALLLGLAEVPVVYTDADPESIKLDRLADNKVGESSRWIPELLAGEISSLAPADLHFVESLDLLIPAPLKPPVEPRGEGEPFITRDNELATASMPSHEYEEVPGGCTRCGAPLFIRRR